MTRKRRFLTPVVAFAVVLGGVLGQSTSAMAQQKLQAPNTALFGASVAVSADGNLALVGAPNTDAPRGAAYVFARSGRTWTLQQKLQVPHPVQLGALRFGSSVSLSPDGRTALIGAQGSNPAIGGEDAAYVFTRGFVGGFTLQQKLVNPTGGFSGNAFGTSVSMGADGRTALVGAPSPTGGAGGGSAYLFARNLAGLWILQQRLLPNDTSDFDGFGTSVVLGADGRSVLVGAPSKGGTGAAYTFARGFVGAFAQQQKLQASDRASGDAFGGAVALSGDGRTALIGAAEKDVGQFQGVAYVFGRNLLGTFAQQQRLQASDRAANDGFGGAVALDRGGSRALIGARGTDGNRGSAYVFGRGFVGGFSQRQELQVAPRVAGDFFGWSVALTSAGDAGVIGAPELRDGSPSPGSAYVFTGLN